MRSLAAATILVFSYRPQDSTYFVHCLTVPSLPRTNNHAAIFVLPSTLKQKDEFQESLQKIRELTQEEPTSSATSILASATTDDAITNDSIAATDDILSSIDHAELMDPTNIVEQVLTPSTSEPPIETPSLRQILNFAVPAIGVWLCSPLLSLIDTSSVGLLSGTAQQAALNPAVAITDYGALLVAFMYTATTNLVASAGATETEADRPRTAKVLMDAMQISVGVGATLATFLTIFARPMLRSIIGNDGINVEVFEAAVRYVRIRALGMPAAVVIGSAQSACLGMKDIKSPLYVLFAAAVVNFIGDMIFVGKSSPWLGGAAGAAWATVFSQYAALTLFIKWLTFKKKEKKESTSDTNGTVEKINLTKSILELTGECESGLSRRKQLQKSLKTFTSSVSNISGSKVQTKPLLSKSTTAKSTPTEKPFSTRGFLAGEFSLRKLLKLPSRKDAEVFKPYFLPVTTTQVGRVSSYIAMSHVVSSALGTTSMAANQIIVSFFYCLTPIADSLNLTAQSFIPGIFEKPNSKARATALKQTKRNFLKAGLVFGAVMSSMMALMPKLSSFFSADPTVLAEVASVVPVLIGIFSIHGLICAGEGVMLGQKDLGFLGKAYAGFFVGVPYFMLRVKKAALSGAPNIGLSSVWTVFFAYQIVRVSLWLARLAQLQRRCEISAALVEETN